MTEPICLCMQYHPREAMELWRRRAMPIIVRWLQHGHRVDASRMTKTLDLVCKLERDAPECSAAENRHRSHHLPGCPVAPRSQGRIAKTVTRNEQAVHIANPSAVTAWAESVRKFLMDRPK